MQLLRDGLREVIEIETPSKLLDPDFDLFAPLVSTVPAYAEYLAGL